MITIKKTGEGYYLASLQKQTDTLDRNYCYFIKKELVKLMKPHREISLDLKGVTKIENNGLKILYELKYLMDNKKCKLRFINIDPSIQKKITELTGKSLKQPKGIDIE
ncbi:MAG: anti-sigma factor antagonist [Bacteroidales bacterium]|nr:anti-sigma factor antagonist [Bacteroidales bacterium]